MRRECERTGPGTLMRGRGRVRGRYSCFSCVGASAPPKYSCSSTFFRKGFADHAARQNEAAESVFCRVRIIIIRVRWRSCCLPTELGRRGCTMCFVEPTPAVNLGRCFLTGIYLTSHSRVLFRSCKSPTWSGISLSLGQLLTRQGDAVQWWTPTGKHFVMLLSPSDVMIPV